jgi:hypothetical protein
MTNTERYLEESQAGRYRVPGGIPGARALGQERRREATLAAGTCDARCASIVNGAGLLR